MRVKQFIAAVLLPCFCLYSAVMGQTAEPKTEAYDKLKAMAEEDSQLRTILDKVADSLNLAKINRKIEYTDSLHSDYLNSYVTKNGWPGAKEGAEYAMKLAVHDHEHYDVYIQALKKAMEQGAEVNEDLQLLTDLAKSEEQYQYFQKKLKYYKGKYMRFEVSSMLQNKLPASIDRIRKIVKEHCPEKMKLIKMLYVVSCRYERTAKLWMKQAGVDMERVANNDILTQLNKEITEACPKAFYEGCCWGISYVPAEHKYTKLVLYVVWAEDGEGRE